MSKFSGTLETPEWVYIGQTNLIKVLDLKDAGWGGSLVTTGVTTELRLLTSAGTHVAGSTGSLTHQAGGAWEGTFSETLDLTDGNKYLVLVTMTKGGDVAHWRRELRANYRD